MEGALPAVGMRVSAELLSVNDVKNEFTLDLVVSLHWSVPPTPDAEPGIVRTAEPTDWKPQILLYNANKQEMTEQEYWVDAKEGIRFAGLNWTAVFRENLELHRFPFDRQNLSFPLYSTNSRLVSFSATDIPTHIHTEAAFISQLDHWKLVSFEERKENLVDPETEKLYVAMIERRTHYYFWSVIFVLSLLVLLSLSVVGVDPAELSDRQQITLTLVLASVAYKYAISQQLPAINYLTYMDYYINGSFALLTINALENLLVSAVVKRNRDLAETIDLLYCGGVAAVWIIFHCLIIFILKTNVVRKSWEDTKKDDNNSTQGVILVALSH